MGVTMKKLILVLVTVSIIFSAWLFYVPNKTADYPEDFTRETYIQNQKDIQYLIMLLYLATNKPTYQEANLAFRKIPKEYIAYKPTVMTIGDDIAKVYNTHHWPKVGYSNQDLGFIEAIGKFKYKRFYQKNYPNTVAFFKEYQKWREEANPIVNGRPTLDTNKIYPVDIPPYRYPNGSIVGTTCGFPWTKPFPTK